MHAYLLSQTKEGEGRGIGLDHVVGVHWGINLELLHMRLGHPGIKAIDLLCIDHWLRLA